ncbi:DUF6748 domain-containing protein [Mesorhizobium sp. ORS 3428]|uniref:DUF6748 domain-containing protein n=1 Tax=Mesorhizobium sp. ORS 3428 TaxID=540997 RepID=UPI0008D97753|nr:DUF6748 domain-containing protein [Mesorhizobium sp. ORS 3428]OHV87459.1 hypothetical protein ORS3428_21395 [Mesorhizobium sp. ORS 3428]
MVKVAKFVALIAGTCVMAAEARANEQGSYVPCDNGLRCVMAPCPSNSALDLATGKIIRGVSIDIERLPQEDKALDLSDKLYAGKLVVAGTIENRPQTLNGKQYNLPTLVATGIERAAKDSERAHCSAH